MSALSSGGGSSPGAGFAPHAALPAGLRAAEKRRNLRGAPRSGEGGTRWSRGGFGRGHAGPRNLRGVGASEPFAEKLRFAAPGTSPGGLVVGTPGVPWGDPGAVTPLGSPADSVGGLSIAGVQAPLPAGRNCLKKPHTDGKRVLAGDKFTRRYVHSK